MPSSRPTTPGSHGAQGAVLIFAVCLALSASPGRPDSRTVAPEYQLKAAFILNFARFVEWPADAMANDDGPFRVVIAGRDPFGELINTLLQGQTVHGHGVSIHRPAELPQPDRCHLLFVGAMKPQQLADLFDRIDGQPILTVGESEEFQQLGGIIRFKLVRDSVRFSINREAAERAGLKVSSKLLRLAENS